MLDWSVTFAVTDSFCSMCLHGFCALQDEPVKEEDDEEKIEEVKEEDETKEKKKKKKTVCTY